MASPVNPRPKSAPTVKLHEPEFDDPQIYERCSLCFKRIFGGSFAEVTENKAYAKKAPICSFKCFQTYVGSQLTEPPNIQQMTLPSVKAKPSIISPKIVITNSGKVNK